MDRIGLCTMVRDEDLYLREWLAYYSLLGVNRFFVYDNESRNPVSKLLEEEVAIGHVVVEDIVGDRPSMEAFNHCLEVHGPGCRWLGVLDVDEYVYLREVENLHDFLGAYEDYGGVGINWMMYGPGRHDARPTGSQIESYVYRVPEEFPENKHIKSFFQTDRVEAVPNPHYAQYKEGYFCVNEKGRRIDGPFSAVSFEKVRINHYFTRSRQDFQEKIEKSMHTANPRSMDDFCRIKNAATIQDHSGIEFLERLRSRHSDAGGLWSRWLVARNG